MLIPYEHRRQLITKWSNHIRNQCLSSNPTISPLLNKFPSPSSLTLSMAYNKQQKGCRLFTTHGSTTAASTHWRKPTLKLTVSTPKLRYPSTSITPHPSTLGPTSTLSRQSSLRMSMPKKNDVMPWLCHHLRRVHLELVRWVVSKPLLDTQVMQSLPLIRVTS